MTPDSLVPAMLCVFILKSEKPVRDASARGAGCLPTKHNLLCLQGSKDELRTGKHNNPQTCSPSLRQGGLITAELSSNLILTSVPWIHAGQGCHCILEIFTPQDCRLWYGCSQGRWHGQDGHLPTCLASCMCLSEYHSDEMPRSSGQ